MTIDELFDKNQIKYNKIKYGKGKSIFKINETNVLFWINNNNVFKLERKWFELLESDCKKYVLFLFDKENKKYYYLKFQDVNNWLSSGFYSCDKPELYLGKQIMNSTQSLAYIISDLKKMSK